MTTALLITFSSSADPAEFAAVAEQFSHAVTAVDGLLSKVWLETDNGGGGFYLFRDDAAVEAYLGGPLVAQIRSHPQFADFRVDRFGVDTELSRRTNSYPWDD